MHSQYIFDVAVFDAAGSLRPPLDGRRTLQSVPRSSSNRIYRIYRVVVVRFSGFSHEDVWSVFTPPPVRRNTCVAEIDRSMCSPSHHSIYRSSTAVSPLLLRRVYDRSRFVRVRPKAKRSYYTRVRGRIVCRTSTVNVVCTRLIIVCVIRCVIII